MTLLAIIGAGAEAPRPIEVRAGDRVLDVCDESAAPILFSCRTASCGVCRVQVLNGAELLAEPGADERDVLATLRAGPHERLACQLFVTSDQGSIQLRAIQPKPRT